MLEPITKRVTDESDRHTYCFIFYCDICENPWRSVPYNSGAYSGGGSGNAREWESEHVAAYERANQEAIMHFNRCPVCKRMVCDECFRILPERDICKECAEQKIK